MNGLAVAAIAMLAVLVYLMTRGRSGSKPASPARRRPVSREASDSEAAPFAAKSIRPGQVACEAVQALDGKRFLLTEAPVLPLSDCDLRNCRCRFRSHGDRRQEQRGDRRLGYGLRSELYATNGNPERRTKRRGRRAEDH
jgi:hypothetical protein